MGWIARVLAPFFCLRFPVAVLSLAGFALVFWMFSLGCLRLLFCLGFFGVLQPMYASFAWLDLVGLCCCVLVPVGAELFMFFFGFVALVLLVL